MGLIAAIQRQSRRSYWISQSALLSALGSSAVGMLTVPASSQLMTSSAATIGAIGLSMFIVHHARRGIYQRLRQAKIAEDERRRLLQSDAVTGAHTRRHFLDELDTALRRKTMLPTTLVLIDIDYFKQLNDSLGHPAGDAALVHTVECLKHHFPNDTIGRLGGDEFAVMIQNEDLARCQRRANEFVSLISRPFRYSGFDVALSVSIGIASSTDRAHDVTGLFQNADLALYASKSAGRGRATRFEEGMLSDRRHIRYMERELRAAIYLDNLELHYQPLVDTEGKTQAHECLVRWRDPVRGLISPAQFIPIAEMSTLIDQIGEWVFRRACRDLDHFPGQRLSINISGAQLKRDVLVAMVERVLKETKREASDFVLEITETAATDATPDVLRRLEALRSMGFRIALDDFGTGHCGFNYLKTLPIDAIKIDRSYIRDLSHDRLAQVLVSALIEVGRLQDIVIVAEGVETEADFELAKAAGCTRFQGYCIARPAPLTPIPRSPAAAIIEEKLALSA